MPPGWWFDAVLRGLRTGRFGRLRDLFTTNGWKRESGACGLAERSGVVRQAHQGRRVRDETDWGAGFLSFDKLRTGFDKLRAGTPGTPDDIWLLGSGVSRGRRWRVLALMSLPALQSVQATPGGMAGLGRSGAAGRVRPAHGLRRHRGDCVLDAYASNRHG